MPRRTLPQELAEAIDTGQATATGIRSGFDPFEAYRGRPVAFIHDVLLMDLWSTQREIAEAFHDWYRVSVVSGHKIGKSVLIAALMLYAYCTIPGVRCVIMAATERQVNGIIWREVQRLARGAAIPIPGVAEIGTRAQTGLKYRDPLTFEESEIKGYTAKEAEAVAGTSGTAIFYAVDEASGVSKQIFDAIEGNRAGGQAWVFLISNPTKADGEFYDSHHSKSDHAIGTRGYKAFAVPSWEGPNCTGEYLQLQEYDRKRREWRQREKPIPGLAMPSWVEDKRSEEGEDSAWFQIRVAGRFVVAENAKIFPLALIIESQQRWPDTKGDGRLWIGVDPAGSGLDGDESGFCARKGLKVCELRLRKGLTTAAHVDQVLDLIAAHHDVSNELPVVCLDVSGDIGSKALVEFRAAEARGKFKLFLIRFSNAAPRQPRVYHLWRDELYAVGRDWMRAGGAIPEHTKLERDLHAPEFQSTGPRGTLQATKKPRLKEILGRSPDIGDALLLSCWESISLRQEEAAAAPVQQAAAERIPTLDPYGGSSLDPYGGNPDA